MALFFTIEKRLTGVAVNAAKRSHFRRFGFALLCVGIATLTRLSLQGILGNSVPWILFYPAVLLSAWYGGLRAGVLATMLSILSCIYLWVELDMRQSSSWLIIGLFAFASVFMSFLAEMWHRALQAEAKIKTELEKQVEERTARLRETIAQLETFSYTVSHDLRSPLRAVNGFADILLQDYGPKLDDPAREHLERIKRAAHRMDRLVLDVLTFSQTGRGELKIEAIDLKKVIQDVVDQYPNINQPHADITVQRPLHPVLASHAPLLQCVSNLLVNAVKFIPADARAKVRIWTERRGDLVRLNIQDNGIGIPASQIPKLFQPFERLVPSAGYEGTGIGLSIVKKAAERMNGKVGVDSVVNQGSTFWIELPAAPSA